MFAYVMENMVAVVTVKLLCIMTLNVCVCERERDRETARLKRLKLIASDVTVT